MIRWNLQTPRAPFRCQEMQFVGAQRPEWQIVSMFHLKAKIASIDDPAEFGNIPLINYGFIASLVSNGPFLRFL